MYLEKAEKLKKEKYVATELKYKIKSESEIADVVNAAYVESELGKSSKKLNTKNIRENRKLEKALMKNENVPEPIVTSATDVTEQKQDKSDDMFDAIKAIRDKKMRKTDG
jgi:polyhydroxyalkanoate synthesis regulator protein